MPCLCLCCCCVWYRTQNQTNTVKNFTERPAILTDFCIAPIAPHKKQLKNTRRRFLRRDTLHFKRCAPFCYVSSVAKTQLCRTCDVEDMDPPRIFGTSRRTRPATSHSAPEDEAGEAVQPGKQRNESACDGEPIVLSWAVSALSRWG